MGLFDSVVSGAVGGLLGGGKGGDNQLLQMAVELIKQNGGLTGLIGSLTQAGLGPQVASWVGTGDNLPVGGDQLQQALGSDLIGQLAGKLGMSGADVGTGLAKVLPELVNRLTPDGSVPTNSDELLAQGLDLLKGRLGL